MVPSCVSLIVAVAMHYSMTLPLVSLHFSIVSIVIVAGTLLYYTGAIRVYVPRQYRQCLSPNILYGFSTMLCRALSTAQRCSEPAHSHKVLTKEFHPLFVAPPLSDPHFGRYGFFFMFPLGLNNQISGLIVSRTSFPTRRGKVVVTFGHVSF